MERCPVLRRSLSTRLPTARNPRSNAVGRRLNCCRIDTFNLHRNFSCLNVTAIGVSRKDFNLFVEALRTVGSSCDIELAIRCVPGGFCLRPPPLCLLPYEVALQLILLCRCRPPRSSPHPMTAWLFPEIAPCRCPRRHRRPPRAGWQSFALPAAASFQGEWTQSLLPTSQSCCSPSMPRQDDAGPCPPEWSAVR